MAGLQDLVRRFDAGGPTVTSQADFQSKWNTANTQADPTAYRQALMASLDAFNQNQSVQNVYGLNQANANTFLKDASAGLTPLATGQNPNTQTYTPDAFKTMTAYEQALMANPKGANALLSEFTGTGANPLLGQYTTLPGGTIIPKAPTTTGAPAGNTSAANISNAGTAAGTTGTSGAPASNTTNASASGTTASGTSTAAKTDLGSLKNYGITNPALISYITSTPGLTDNDLKNLASVYNSKTAQQIAVAQQADDPLHVIANAMVSHDATVKERLTDPKSYIYNQGNVPVYKPASQSTNAIGDVFTTKNSGIVDQWKDASGYLHITSGGNQYLINPNSNRIISSTPITHGDPNPPIWSSGASGSGIAGMASGGSVRMPQEYSQGNWKLI